MPSPWSGVSFEHMTTVFVTGGTGYLGERLLPMAADRSRVVAGARQPRAISRLYNPVPLDLCDRMSVMDAIRKVQPDAIIHAAALNPGVDDAMMNEVNALGTEYVAQAAQQIGARLVFVSTDVVHDGQNAPYTDNAEPSPINEYGRSKAAAESLALNAHPNTIAVRTSLIYGLDSMDRGTIGFARRLDQGEPLNLFSDVLRQPVWRDALATSLLRLALDFPNETGVINIAGSDLTDRATFGELMLKFWHIPTVEGSVRHIAAAGRADLASVPLNTQLSLDRAAALSLPLPGVYKVLEQHAGKSSCRSI